MWRLFARPTVGAAAALATARAYDARGSTHSLAASPPLFNLEGKVALVTGGSRGLGYAIASGLLEHGATVIISGTNRTTLNAAREALLRDNLGVPHARCSCIAFDVQDEAECIAAVREVAQRTGRTPDILVNNACVHTTLSNLECYQVG